jgi:hypothetical protein
MMPPMPLGPITIEEIAGQLGIKLGEANLLRWPPDIFAFATTLLQRSDAYCLVVSRWPPSGATPSGWANSITEIGKQWRAAAVDAAAPIPPQVIGWWDTLSAAGALEVSEVRHRDVLAEACLQLVAAADEASAGTGVIDPGRQDGYDRKTLAILLQRPSGGCSLCQAIDPSRAIVLPKMHTPQNGVTIRSLSHNLTLCDSGEVQARWFIPPRGLESESLNLLLLPWPLEVLPRSFRRTEGRLANMNPETFGFFTVEGPDSESDKRLLGLQAEIKKLTLRAEHLVGRIDAIVFPELSLHPGDCKALAKSRGKIVIGGEGRAAELGTSTPGENCAVVAIPMENSEPLVSRQPKHHRWQLDEQQIAQYGLGAQLDPGCAWWEYIPVGDRSLYFWALSPWLTFCVLICEDLARQEPIARVVRAVGPNLVIALLMDGPQLAARWSARYATVLADDPGSSVLTLTSYGMVQLTTNTGKPPSNVIGLWKDGEGSAPREITLEPGASGVVLCLSRRYINQWSADGRDDAKATGSLLLHGVHQVKCA